MAQILTSTSVNFTTMLVFIDNCINSQLLFVNLHPVFNDKMTYK
jgi:hypothetical protein